ncbi:MAG TPA: acyltransferase family protein, partial [Pseudomonas sp.]|nr:acyltransferase family protein [Pseudomonas sp.]
LFTWGGASALLVLGAIWLEPWTARTRVAAPLSFLGDASYSIYLSHPFVLALFGKLFSNVPLAPGLEVLLVILSGVTVLAVGMATHLLLEKPIIEVGKRLAKPKPQNN